MNTTLKQLALSAVIIVAASVPAAEPKPIVSDEKTIAEEIIDESKSE